MGNIYVEYINYMYVTSVQRSDSQFIAVTLHLWLLWNTGYISYVI